MKILKFGGTSVADSRSIDKVISILKSNDEPLFIVVSALSGITNLLQKCLNKNGESVSDIITEIEQRHLQVITDMCDYNSQTSLKNFLRDNLNELDDLLNLISETGEVSNEKISKVLTFGEILSSNIIYEILRQKGLDISHIDSRELIFTKNSNSNIQLDDEKTSDSIDKIVSSIKSKLIISPGYICSNQEGKTSNLGRGCSDYSAAIYAKYLNAKVLEIWTDVSGVFSANPKIVKNASPIAYLSYKEAMELSFFGAKVIYFPTLQPLIMITQASSEFSICIAIDSNDADLAKKVVDEEFEFEISQQKINKSQIESNLANIAIVGDKMKSKKGISGKLFNSLGNNSINVRAIAQGASERNISIIIDKNNAKKALNALHESFFEKDLKDIHLFITGVGNVGGYLLQQIKNQKDFISKNLGLNLKVLGISNSKKMLISKQEIDLNNWSKVLTNSDTKADKDFFQKTIIELNRRNSLFIDNTASETIPLTYNSYLKNGIGVITCNKISNSGTLDKYKELRKLSRRSNAAFLYETNVGAALPVISTLKNLINSGDKILKIEAVLSGTLNYIFNNFQEEDTFHDIVSHAVKLGYTEPDPKIDLCGVDVSRKILILARESGFNLEYDEVEKNHFLPTESINTDSKDEFILSLKNNKDHFNRILNDAKEKNCRLKFVAKLDNGKASVGLEAVPNDHPFYNLAGSDNITVFFSERYKESPLVVKGAGAGGEFTASGVFADIIKASQENG